MKRTNSKLGLGWNAVVGMGVCACLSLTFQVRAASDSDVLRVMSWNIHHGAGLDGRLDVERIASLIGKADADLVALQEVDRGVARTERRDLPKELAELTGMTSVFSNNYHYQGGEYGNAILSRLPVSAQTNRHYRMLREGEQRGLLEARVEWHGTMVRFFSTHLDYRSDDAERRSNVKEIRTIIGKEPGVPVIVAGDFNTLPESRAITGMKAFMVDAWQLAEQGQGPTYPSSDPERRIDYIFLGGERVWRVGSAEVLSSDASDHLPVVVELELGERGANPSER